MNCELETAKVCVQVHPFLLHICFSPLRPSHLIFDLAFAFHAPCPPTFRSSKPVKLYTACHEPPRYASRPKDGGIVAKGPYAHGLEYRRLRMARLRAYYYTHTLTLSM